MSGAHTPGPWKMWTSCSFRRISSEATGKDGDVLHAVVQRSDGHPDLCFPNGGFTGPDALMMVAAPKMLEALRIASEFMSIASDWNIDEAEIDGEMRSTYEWLEIVNAAIAEATGVAP